jgi:uncharacterized protein
VEMVTGSVGTLSHPAMTVCFPHRVSTEGSPTFRVATIRNPGLTSGRPSAVGGGRLSRRQLAADGPSFMPMVPAMSQVATLTCPKCGGEMRTYERNGVVVDQCTECRGIFLDRGELEHLVDAEGRHYDDSGDRRRDDEHPKKSKKRSFLENLFEAE